MKNLSFKFYSVLKNEDAIPYVSDDILVVADGLGGSGSSVHEIDRAKHADLHGDIMESAYGDMKAISLGFSQYIEGLILPMIDGKDDTSALWASRIVIARCVYALTEGEFKNADLSDSRVRAQLAAFISKGLHEVVKKFGLQKGKYDGQLLLPTTLAFIRYTETENTVIAETLWAGDSRCYALTPDGLRVLSVDDEDDSGSITNLFYADNEKVTLYYICHEIAKPCALFTVSDGVFDPFAPHDHLGVEHTLLSAIKESDSVDMLSDMLKEFYDGVHGDDSTMAFAAFGFYDYGDMKIKLSKRTNEILAIRQKQAELYGALEVMNQTEEEASHYVLSRTGDRYDYIAPMIVDMIENGSSDIALTPEIKKIAENVKRDFGLVAEKERKQKREQTWKELYEYVKAHPELVSPQILTNASIDFRGNYRLQYDFSDMKKYATEYVAAMRDKTISDLESTLEARSEDMHRKIMARILHYRERFDSLWNDKTLDYNRRERVDRIIRTWQKIDMALQYQWRPSEIGTLPESDRALAYEVSDYIDEYKRTKAKIKAKRDRIESSYKQFMTCWNTVFNYIKSNPDTIFVLLSPEIIHKFGFDMTDKSFAIELGKCKRERMLRELRERKGTVVPGIVKALAVNCDKTSLIDSQYNATKLDLFRTYFRLKKTDSGELKAFELQLAELEVAYTGWVIK